MKIWCLTALLVVAGCKKNVEPTAEVARAAASGLTAQLGQALKAALAASGPTGAIAVCKQTAPALAAAASEKTGLLVKRVSLKTRNPGAAPDEWEKQALLSLEEKQKAGLPPDQLETFAVVDTDA